MNILQSIFGPNWRTTVSGSITAIAGVIAANNSLVSFLPESSRLPVTCICSLITAVAGVTFARMAKDRNLSGNGTENEPYKVAQADGQNITLPPEKLP